MADRTRRHVVWTAVRTLAPLLIATLVAVALMGEAPRADAASGSVQNVYWTDRSGATVSVTDLDTGMTQQLVASTGGRLQDVDLDATTGTLYFADWGVPGGADPNEGTIYQVNTDGSGLAVVLGALPDAVHQLALDPANGLLYFTQGVSYTPNQVSRVDYTGLNYTQLRFSPSASLGSHFPSGLALDSANGLVYWGDIGVLASDGAVNSMDLAGGSVMLSLAPHVNGQGRGFALDPGTQTIFLTAHNQQQPASGGMVLAYDIGLQTITPIIGPDATTGYWDIEIDPVTQRIWYAAPGAGEIRSAMFDGTDVRVELSGLTEPYGLALEFVPPPPPPTPTPGPTSTPDENGNVFLTLASPVCIGDDRVLSDPAATGLGVGSQFTSSVDGLQYEIFTGGPFCKVNCEQGFDFNCDGKLGDFCSVELNLDRVDDVRSCLGLSAPIEPTAAVAAATPPVPDSVPAAVPVAVPAPAGERALAHTGTEGTLGTLGLALVAAGAAATALSLRRRRSA